MHIRNIFLGIVLLFNLTLHAQQDAEISVGDTLYFTECKGDAFTYIDLYKKSRIDPNDTFNYDNLTDWDFYNTFFAMGDFDVTRLPCSYKNQYGIIKHIMAIEKPTGGEEPPMIQTVVIVMIEKGLSAAYIIEEAFTEGEIALEPTR